MTKRLVRITDWPQRATQSNWTVQTLAAQCGVSVSTLERYVKKQFGLYPRDWLARLQMAQATEMLVEGFSVKQTALQLGYRHPNHFSRDFKKHTGFSPSQLGFKDRTAPIA